ncbi:unnamed protein product [Acanthoscelides obtectus]|nr:unnamed protein product [Acanthoscelides obtectus]CAK1638905.1 Breast cancer type 2 susceptibility protein homolog [Acanthoscelides obtectus]
MAEISTGTEDKEVSKILNNPPQDPEADKLSSPGSPVLSNNFNNLTRKLCKRRSRVKLADKFKSETAVEPLDKQIQKFHEESFTASQANNLAAVLDRIESIEHNRRLWYNMITTDKQDDIYFKKPLPLCSKSHINNSSVELDDMQIQRYDKSQTHLPPVQLPVCSSFQTAAGKKMEISDSDIKKQAWIFEGIHQPTLGRNTCNAKQYNFLRKPDTGQNNATDIGNNVNEESKFRKSNASKISENVDDAISLTQEISKSGISDTQILSIVDIYNMVQNSRSENLEPHEKIFNKNVSIKQESISQNKKEDQVTFIGFSNNDIEQSHSHVYSLKNTIKKISTRCSKTYSENNSKKRVHELVEMPASKKMKLGPFNAGIKSSSVVRTSCSFSSASGKHIIITSNAFKKASNILDNIENDLGTLEVARSTDSDSLKKSTMSLDPQCTNCDDPANLLSKNQVLYNPQSIPKEVAHKSILKNINWKLNNQNVCSGFATASGKSMVISEKSKLKAKQVFGEILDDTTDGHIVRTTIKNKHTLLDDAIKKAECSGKPESGIIPQCTEKSIILNNINYRVNNENACPGFATASGKSMKISEKSKIKAKEVFGNIFDNTGDDNIAKTTSKNKLKLLDEAIKEAETSGKPESNIIPDCVEGDLKNHDSFHKVPREKLDFTNASVKSIILTNINFNTENACSGFANASGKSMTISEKLKLKAMEDCGDILDSTEGDNIAKTISVNKLMLLDDTTRKAEHFNRSEPNSFPKSVENDQKLPTETLGFTNADGEKYQLSESSLSKAKQMLGDFISNETESANRLASKNKFKLLDKAIKKAEINMGIQPSSVEDDFRKRNLKNTIPPQLHKNPFQPKSFGDQVVDHSEVHTPKREDSLLKRQKRKLGISSCKQIRIPEQNLKKAKLLFDQEIQSISPVKPIGLHIQQNHNTPVRLEGSFSRTDGKYCSTPLQNNLATLKTLPVESPIVPERRISYEGPELSPESFFVFGAPTKGCMADWVMKYSEERKLLEEKLKKIQDREAELLKLDETKTTENRICLGVLYQKKKSSNRLNLRVLLDEICTSEDTNQDLFFVSPENAADFHFKCDVVLNTEDGATIVPNLDDLVGLSEIQLGIETMAGVEARLIPTNWIKNHYKWIVWKLASYERRFPNKCKGILNIENVVQQLKYRYDREIDKVERSALRRIVERDDAPQKRMVLCVSAIKSKGFTKHEIELTDGWYAVKTVIDEPLCAQVYGKIQVGTKLVTCGAELLNCDGCHPLEATDLVSLRINYNNTRRACWNAKLGYQKYPQPFPIKICSIHPSGGTVGAIKICIIRVYPLKFLERLGTNTVWRNKKAEERRAQEWENEMCRKIENLHSNSKKNLQGVRDEVNNLITRDISVVFRLLVIDLLDSEYRTYTFHVWRPSESHIQDLREGKSMTVYNVVPKKSGELSSCSKTLFKPVITKQNLPDKFLRKVTFIEDISSELMKDFREFDTVGIIVQSVIEDNFQKVWIAGVTGR